jgi:VRR-NUC domain
MPSNPETLIQKNIITSLNQHPKIRLFRNQVGAIDLGGGRLMRFGMGTGSSDLIGYITIKITPDMVGQEIAQFCGIEVKTAKGKVTELQQAFIDRVNAAGGVAGVAHSVTEALRIIGYE